MNQQATSTNSKKRNLSDEEEEDLRPAKMPTALDPEDMKGNNVKIFTVVSNLAATSERHEKTLEDHKKRIQDLERKQANQAKDNNISKDKQHQIITNTVTQAMKKK